MKAVLLAGGLGTRMREETEYRPKPMVEIGGEPILFHIMRNLAQHGITEFIIASGYKSQIINDYFLNDSQWVRSARSTPDLLEFHGTGEKDGWSITTAFTGETTETGGRVARVRKLLGDRPFFVAYGDGLADVDVSQLIQLHRSSGKLATVTAVQPTSRFGLMEIEPDGQVTHFREKPKIKDWVSIGYFIFEPEVFNYLHSEGGLEEQGLTRLAGDGQLSAYRHEGFWQPMDTYREYKILEELWESGRAPWKTW